MRASLLLSLTGLLAWVGLASSAAPTLLITGKSGVYHLDSYGKLLEYRNETLKSHQGDHAAVNQRNGTFCWVVVPKGLNGVGFVRCAPTNDLSTSWDLPPPKNFRVNFCYALDIDPDSGNFHITVEARNYVCSYDFQTCAKIGKSYDSTRYYAAYDIPNRLVFMINPYDGQTRRQYMMEVMNLDGSNRRLIADNSSLWYPTSLAIDSADRMIYFLDRQNGTYQSGLFRFDYEGQNKELLMTMDGGYYLTEKRRVKIVGDSVYITWGIRRRVSRIDKKTGEITHLVDSKVTDGVTEIPISELEFQSLNLVSEDLQPYVENNCLRSRGGCGDICVPTVVNDAPSHTCICPPGQELVDTACFEREPATVIVVHKNALQAVDVYTEEAQVILPGLTDATKADFYYEKKLSYLIFWLDDGGLFRGHWQYGGQVTDVVTLVPPGGAIRVVEVAVDWNQRNVLWIEQETVISGYETTDKMNVKIANVYGTSVKTLATDNWRDPSALFVYRDGLRLGYQEDSNGTREFRTKNMKGEDAFHYGFKLDAFKLPYKMREISADLSAVRDYTDDRYLWVDLIEDSVQVTLTHYTPIVLNRTTLMTDPSLKNTGGMDVFFDQLFWTDRSVGELKMASSETGENVRIFGPSVPIADLRGVRVLHPLKQPLSAMGKVCDLQNNGCSNICVRMLEDNESIAACACPDGKALGNDGKICV